MDLRWKKQFRDGSLFEIEVSDFGFIGFDGGSSFIARRYNLPFQKVLMRRTFSILPIP